LGEQREALAEGVQTTGLPSCEDAGQTHPRFGTFAAARSPTDLAGDHERPQTAFSEVVVCRKVVYQYELEQFILMPQQALGQCLARMLFLTGLGQAEWLQSL
jgi:hypothetical protein